MSASRRRGRRAVEDNVHIRLASRLTARDRWVIRMLAEHRVLTTTQLDQLAFTGPRQLSNPTPTSAARAATRPSPRAAQMRLRALAELGVIARFRLPSPTGTGTTQHCWVTTPLSFTLLAAEDGAQPPTPRRTPSPASSTNSSAAQPIGPAASGRWGVALAHNQQLHHQLGTNACLVALTTAHPHPHLDGGRAVGQVRLWWGQARAGRHLTPARPDAYALWTDTPTPSQPTPPPATPPAPTPPAGALSLAFALEYDTGTEPLHRVAVKLASYHTLALATTITTPVLFWLPTPRREAHLRAALTDTIAALPAPQLVPIATASPHPDLPGQGWHPHAPIWAPLITDQTPTPPRHTSPRPVTARLSLSQLAATLGQPTHTHHNRIHRIDRIDRDLPAHHGEQVGAIRITQNVQVLGRPDLYSQDLVLGREPDHHRDPGDHHGARKFSFGASAPWWPPSPIAPAPADTRFPHPAPTVH